MAGALESTIYTKPSDLRGGVEVRREVGYGLTDTGEKSLTGRGVATLR
jgi:hypothetical protein